MIYVVHSIEDTAMYSTMGDMDMKNSKDISHEKWEQARASVGDNPFNSSLYRGFLLRHHRYKIITTKDFYIRMNTHAFHIFTCKIFKDMSNR